MDNQFEIENGVLTRYLGGAEAVIPEGVNEIGEYAFMGCEELVKVTIPGSVRRIGQQAFRGCDGLIEAVLPEGIEVIPRYLFCDCGSLRRVVLPESVREIGPLAFRRCDMMTGIEIPAGVTCIGESAFSDCLSIRSITLPEGVGVIKKRTFSGCRRLEELKILGEVTDIGDFAFENCAALTSVELPRGLRRLGQAAFRRCTELRSVTAPESLGFVGSSAFAATPFVEESREDMVIIGGGVLIACRAAGDAVVPEGVRVIGENAFSGSDGLTSVTLPGTVEIIEDLAFEQCRELKRVELGEGLRSIGSRAFVDCGELEEIELPRSLLHLGTDALYGTKVLGRESAETVIMGGRILVRCHFEGGSFAVPEGIEVLGDSAFAGAAGIEELTLPEGLRTIGDQTFRWLRDLKRVTIPDSVDYIGSMAFMSAEGLSAELSAVGKTVGEVAFAHGARLTLRNGPHSFTVRLEDDVSGSSPIMRFAAEPSEKTFGELGEVCYKAPAAVCYCGEIGACREYLKSSMEEVLCCGVANEENELLESALETGFADAAAIDSAIALAIGSERLEQQLILMRKKNELAGGAPVGDVIDGKFSL